MKIISILLLLVSTNILAAGVESKSPKVFGEEILMPALGVTSEVKYGEPVKGPKPKSTSSSKWFDGDGNPDENGYFDSEGNFHDERLPPYYYWGGAVQVTDSMTFDFSHTGVDNCERADAEAQAAWLCKEKFRLPLQTRTSIILDVFKNDKDQNWPWDARECQYNARAICQIQWIPPHHIAIEGRWVGEFEGNIIHFEYWADSNEFKFTAQQKGAPGQMEVGMPRQKNPNKHYNVEGVKSVIDDLIFGPQLFKSAYSSRQSSDMSDLTRTWQTLSVHYHSPEKIKMWMNDIPHSHDQVELMLNRWRPSL